MGKAAASFDVGLPTLKLITDALKQPLGYDIREGKTVLGSLSTRSVIDKENLPI